MEAQAQAPKADLKWQDKGAAWIKEKHGMRAALDRIKGSLE